MNPGRGVRGGSRRSTSTDGGIPSAADPPIGREGRGQATVEAALTLPIILISLLLVVQVGVVVRDALALGLVAREGAREAAVWADDVRAVAAARRSAGPLEAARIDIRLSDGPRRRGEPVTVSVSYVERLRIPVVDRIVDLDLPLRASATMRLERSE